MIKQNIVLLHGALGCKSQLQKLKSLLSDEFNVYDLNFEGHGDIPSDNDFSINLFSSNLDDFLKENNVSKTNIFGYSMGGYVALQFALNHADKVDKIITLGTKFEWNKEAAAKEVKMLNPDKIEAKIPAFAKHLNALHSAQSWKIVMKKTAKMMIDLGNGLKLTESDLKAITHPVLIGLGDLDNMVTKEESNSAANSLQNGTLKIIENFQHPIERVDVEVLYYTILGFLKDHL